MNVTRRRHYKRPLMMVPSVLDGLTALDWGEPTRVGGGSCASLRSLSVNFGAGDKGAWVIIYRYLRILGSHEPAAILPCSMSLVWKDETSVIAIVTYWKGNCFLTRLLLMLLHNRHHVVLLFWETPIPWSLGQGLLGLESRLRPGSSHF